jgi:hypothetical protein
MLQDSHTGLTLVMSWGGSPAAGYWPPSSLGGYWPPLPPIDGLEREIKLREERREEKAERSRRQTGIYWKDTRLVGTLL